MNGELMLATACEVAKKIGARAVVSFIEPAPVIEGEPEIPIIKVQELQLDVLKDLTMHDILEVSERHLLDAAVHLYLRRNFETGLVIGVTATLSAASAASRTTARPRSAMGRWVHSHSMPRPAR